MKPTEMNEPKTEWKDDLIRNERMDFLRGHCDTWSPDIGSPFEHEILGKRYISATDRHGIVLLHALPEETTARRFGKLNVALSTLDDATWHSVKFDSLWRFLMKPPPEKCPNCGGVGFVYMPGYAAFDAEGCGPEHDLYERCDCYSEGRLLGTVINRRLLREKIGILSADAVEVATKNCCVGVRAPSTLSDGAPDWIVVVMGLDAQEMQGLDSFEAIDG